MADYLLKLSARPRVRKAIKLAGLPLPMPQTLRRARGPWTERPLADLDVLVGTAPGSSLAAEVAHTLVRAGANPLLAQGALLPHYEALGEAYGRPARVQERSHPPPRVHGLLLDATGVDSPGALGALYEFFHPSVQGLSTCGRVVVLARPPAECATPEATAAQAAVEGFVRSLAKEVGRRGSTAMLIRVSADAVERLEPVLRFVLSARSAFVSGQVIGVSSSVTHAGETPWTRPLEGRVALVTGAARGIGAATARRLAEEGAHVVCLDRPGDEELTARIAREVGGTTLLADMADPATPARIAHTLAQEHGGVDVVVHNAGVTRDRTLGRMDQGAWDTVMSINLAAVAATMRSLIDENVLHDDGRVVCLSSIAGLAGNAGQTNYAASKAGIVGLVSHWGRHLAERGVAVNAVAPGFIETRMTAAVPLLIREAGRRLSSLGQGGLPVDVAEVITFLASPGAAGLSGSVLRVCGGAFIGA